jgi:preprotein translocase subunit Sec63
MKLTEILVILVGLVVGYLAVRKLFFQTPKVDVQSPPSPPPNTRPAWYDTLQISASADAAEIRDAYKHLISKYHPDKVDSLGQELRDLAGQKSQEITAAYREGMNARGERP